MKDKLEILLDTVEDFLKLGEHEGPCEFYDSPISACKFHVENFLRREAAMKAALALYRPCKPTENVL
jgi:hypothetical protein